MGKRDKKIKASGGGRLKEQGRHLVWVHLDAKDKHRAKIAAGFAGVSLSQLFIQAGLAEVQKILEKNSVRTT